MAPTLARLGPYRFFFYSNEQGEPPHVHVQEGSKLAKLWLVPVSLARSVRFQPHELTKIERLVREHRDVFLEVWNDYHGG